MHKRLFYEFKMWRIFLITKYLPCELTIVILLPCKKQGRLVNMKIIQKIDDSLPELLSQYKKSGNNLDVLKDDIAVEIVMQGTQGYRSNRNDYRISVIPANLFSCYQILSYYYVSWKLVMPELVDQLGFNYAKQV